MNKTLPVAVTKVERVDGSGAGDAAVHDHLLLADSAFCKARKSRPFLSAAPDYWAAANFQQVLSLPALRLVMGTRVV
jgi:hypothetical protein